MINIKEFKEALKKADALTIARDGKIVSVNFFYRNTEKVTTLSHSFDYDVGQKFNWYYTLTDRLTFLQWLPSACEISFRVIDNSTRRDKSEGVQEANLLMIIQKPFTTRGYTRMRSTEILLDTQRTNSETHEANKYVKNF